MPTGLHPHPHLFSIGREIAVELLCFLAVLQSSLATISSFGIHKSNLLKARVVVTTNNDHIASFSRAFGWLSHQSLLGPRSRHCHGINCTQNPLGVRMPTKSGDLRGARRGAPL